MYDKMVIGIPKSLLWHKYKVFWEEFFRSIGCKTVVSASTDQKTVEKGVKISIDELCIPVKIFNGHCLNLMEKCDKIFVPRYWRVDREGITCPKFIALTDTANQILKDKYPSKVLSLSINVKRRPMFLSFLQLGLKVRKNPFKIIRAYNSAVEAEKKHKKFLEKKFMEKISDPGLKVAVIGHEYNIHDNYVNQDLIYQIEEMGLTVITSDLVPEFIFKEHLREKPFVYWSYEREIIGAAYWAMASKKISGIILLSSFNCGPDSFLYEQLMLEDSNKPILSILFDEYTSNETVKTRVEAFVELLKRKKIEDYE
jgi:predicted nucleotide-binding protein (sugar kinase/HSP70/actin superfamily)